MIMPLTVEQNCVLCISCSGGHTEVYAVYPLNFFQKLRISPFSQIKLWRILCIWMFMTLAYTLCLMHIFSVFLNDYNNASRFLKIIQQIYPHIHLFNEKWIIQIFNRWVKFYLLVNIFNVLSRNFRFISVILKKTCIT